jgi:hypothetical protein
MLVMSLVPTDMGLNPSIGGVPAYARGVVLTVVSTPCGTGGRPSTSSHRESSMGETVVG